MYEICKSTTKKNDSNKEKDKMYVKCVTYQVMKTTAGSRSNAEAGNCADSDAVGFWRDKFSKLLPFQTNFSKKKNKTRAKSC